MEQFYTKITSFFGTLQTRENLESWIYGRIFIRYVLFYHTEGVKRDNSLNNIRRSVEFHVGKFF